MNTLEGGGAPVRKAIMDFMILLESLMVKPGLTDDDIGEKTATKRSNGPNIRAAITRHLGISLVEEKIGKKLYHRLSDEDAGKFRLLAPTKLDWQQLLVLSWLVNNRPLILGAYAPDEMRELKTTLGLIFPHNPDEAMQDLRRCTYFSPIGKTNDRYNSWQDAQAGASFLEELYTAMTECRSLEIGFVKRSGETDSRVFNPLLFFEKQGTSYILVEDANTRELRILRPNSIRSIGYAEDPEDPARESKFKPRDLAACHHFIDCTFGNFYPGSGDQLSEIQVHFTAAVARYVEERTWTRTESQSVDLQPDGGILLTLTTFINDELVRWLAGFGSDARVLHPEVLRARVKDVHVKALEGWVGDHA